MSTALPLRDAVNTVNRVMGANTQIEHLFDDFIDREPPVHEHLQHMTENQAEEMPTPVVDRSHRRYRYPRLAGQTCEAYRGSNGTSMLYHSRKENPKLKPSVTATPIARRDMLQVPIRSAHVVSSH